jgi:hypothetical protein
MNALKQAFALLLLAAAPVLAQTPAEIEGRIESATATTPTEVTLVVMGMTVKIDTSRVPVVTPTATLSHAQIVDPTPFPNRTEPGFIGGTAIVIGTVDNTGVLTAEFVFMEPAENIIRGLITAMPTPTTPLRVNGVEVQFLADPRIPALPIKNEFGFRVNFAGVTNLTAVALEGYHSAGIFNAFLLEVGGFAPLASSAPQVSLTRALGREQQDATVNDRLEIRGAITMGHTLNNTQTLTILGVRADNSTFVLSNTVVATRQLDDPRFGLYRLSIQFNDLPGGSVLPVSVRVLNPDPAALGASVTEAVEVR